MSIPQSSQYANPMATNPATASEPVAKAFEALSMAAAEAGQASDQFEVARQRWTSAQAQLAEANDRVNRSREASGI